MEKTKVGRKKKPVRTIAIDCGSLSVEKSIQGGTATILDHFLRALPTVDKRHSYLLYSFTPLSDEIIHRFEGRAKNIVLRPSFGYFSLRLPLALKSAQADLFLACSQAIPNNAPSTLGFIYDVGFVKNPQLYPQAERLLKLTQNVIAKSAHIITTSRASRNDIMEKFNTLPENVTVAYPGVSDDCTPIGSRYIGQTPYFLCVGHLKPSKNIPFVIEAFHAFMQKNGEHYQLVLVGSTETMDPHIKETISKFNLTDKISMPGPVSRVDLCKYYRGALALLMPSYVEGFGLPALEALACGTPIVVSTQGSLPEVAGKAGLYVEPKDHDGLAKIMRKIALNPQFRERCALKGLTQAARFSWKSYAKTIVGLIETLTTAPVKTLQ